MCTEEHNPRARYTHSYTLPPHPAINKDGRTPLSLVVENGSEAIVRLLLEKGADCECQNVLNQTPLMLAAENGQEALVRLLLGCRIVAGALPLPG